MILSITGKRPENVTFANPRIADSTLEWHSPKNLYFALVHLAFTDLRWDNLP